MSGSNPNWVTGYIPPATEWNAWFGFKLDAASPLLNGAPFMPLGGGTMTDDLAVSGKVTATDDINTSGDINATGTVSARELTFTSGWTLYNDASNDDIYLHKTSDYDTWFRANGLRSWTTNNVTVMTLDKDGNIHLTGGITSNADMAINGDIAATGSITSSRLDLGSGYSLYHDPSNDDVVQHSTGEFDLWVRASGVRQWYHNGAVIMELKPVGDLSITGKLSLPDSFSLYSDSSHNHITFHGSNSSGNFYDVWNVSNGSWTWVSASVNRMILDAAGNLTVTGVVDSSNVREMTETIDELRALVQDLQTRLEVLERTTPV